MPRAAGAYDLFERGQERQREVAALLARRRNEARAGGAQADRRGTHALMTKVRQAERALERVDAPGKPFEPWELQLALEAGQRTGDVVAALRSAVVERPDADFRLGPVELDLAWGERVVVTGPNGSGKSTLLAALLGELPLEAGDRVVGRQTRDRRRSTSGATRTAARRRCSTSFRARAGLPAGRGAHAACEVRPRRRPRRPSGRRRSRPASGRARSSPSCRRGA